MRVGKHENGKVAGKNKITEEIINRNERTAMSSRWRSRGITFVSTSRLVTGEDRKDSEGIRSV